MRFSHLLLYTLVSFAIATPRAIAETSNLSVEALPDFSETASANTSRPQITLPDLAVTATNIQVKGADPELQKIVLSTIATQLGSATSESLLQNDAKAILSTELFADVQVGHFESNNGWDIVYEVQPAIVRSLNLQNAKVLDRETADRIFADQFNQPVSPSKINASIAQLNQWYEENGYAIAQVRDVRTTREGLLNIDVAEGVVRSVNVTFLDKEGQITKGRTDEDFIKQQLQVQPGEVFQVATAQEDLRKLYQLGLFQNANIALDGDANQLDVNYQLSEDSARGVSAGGGYSESTGIFGTVSYNDRNIGGIGQTLGLEITAGTRDLQFSSNFGSPYRATNPDMPGYNVNAFRNRGISTNFQEEVLLANGDRPREGRFGGGVNFNAPVGEWQASAGLNYAQVSIRDSDGNLASSDRYGNALSVTEKGIDDLVTVQAGISRDLRDNPSNPTSGSVLSVSTEQSLPVGQGTILSNRLEANYSHFTPTQIFDEKNPEVIALNVQGGTTIGDLPPYRNFTLGGTNSVRGYDFAELGGSRSYFLASAEYRVPLFASPVTGVLFADFGTNLGSSSPTLGENGVEEIAKGIGFGYGAGIRLNSPVGVIRADFGLSDRGDSRLHFGIGHRF
ncbi:BamA/TamA family outer membrane protein [Spirulina sp. 06S082]|uniref:BamA/TamA family outer membrane protein n=1 Tax=Spirulina sp. 06S082 TaxID=3110248 RepID=UPI002B1F1E2E|nr:BamA/TamA family outer membrane protein [Spirulina sp. 06S082]MEA5467922.1 BamA/TamA family outer membrane protein [Spirulina sp. 06S082]